MLIMGESKLRLTENRYVGLGCAGFRGGVDG